MFFPEARNLNDTVVNSLTEQEFAKCKQQQGINIIEHRGRYWQETIKGFYEPLHWLARLKLEQSTNPTPLSWGFRTTLCEDEADFANGLMPIHVLPNLKSYHLDSLNSKSRNKIRKCQKLVNILELTSPKILQEQGYEVVVSALNRTAYTQPPSKDKYLQQVTNYFGRKGHLVLAGFIDGKLGGYMTAYVVNGIAYIENTMIDTEALSTAIAGGLIFEFAQICRRSSEVNELVNGLHSRENQSLCIFKEGMGFQVKYAAVKVQMNKIIEYLIRWKYPHKYYRLTGHD